MQSARADLSCGLLRALLVSVMLLVAGSAVAQEQTWKINLKNADINEFVSQIAAITGKTFVVDPRVKGKVTVISNASLNEHDVYELFLSVLRVHGFAAIETSGVVRVQQQTLAKQSGSPMDEAKEIAGEELVTRVIAAQYVDSNELVKTLRPMIPQYGNIAAITNPNVVIISDHAENVVRLMKLIERIDVPGDERVVVVPLKDAWVGNVVELLQKLAPEQLGSSAKGPQSIQIIANERNNSLVLRGKTRPLAEIQKLISELDQPASETGATQVIYLSHADAKNVAEILRALVAGGANAGGGSSRRWWRRRRWRGRRRRRSGSPTEAQHPGRRIHQRRHRARRSDRDERDHGDRAQPRRAPHAGADRSGHRRNLARQLAELGRGLRRRRHQRRRGAVDQHRAQPVDRRA